MATYAEDQSMNFRNDVHDYSHERVSGPHAQDKMSAKRKRQEVAWNTIFLTVPMLVLTIILFAFVFGYRIDIGDEPFPNLKGNESVFGDNDAYYVDLNSTFLIFLASWMSSLAPMLAGFAITLAAYPIAGRLYEDTMHENRDRLLTPFQLNMTLRVVNGSTWSGLWSLLQYRMGWGKRIQRQGAALISFYRIIIVVIFLSTLVFGADTWLHVVTETVNLVQLTALPPEGAQYSLSLLSPNCTSTNNTIPQLSFNNLTCTVDPGTVKLQDGTAALQTLNNQSNTISVFNNGPNTTLAYLALSSQEKSESHDFTAITFGMHTVCRPITQACGLGTVDNDSTAFNCSNGAFAGTLDTSGLPQGYFNDLTTSEFTVGGARNPFDYTVASLSQVSANPVTNIADDPDILLYADGDLLAVILACRVTLYDVEYDLVEGNVTRLITTPSNTTVVNVFEPGLEQTTFGWSSLQNALQIASVVANDAQELANQFAIAYSKVALSIGAGSLIQTPVIAAQERSTTLAAKVPKAPLFLLVVTNLIFVVMGFLLALLAARTSQEAHEVQSRFSIAGIVANMFEEEKAGRPADALERLFSEYWEGNRTKRVGIGRTSNGGYVFRTIEKEAESDVYHSTA